MGDGRGVADPTEHHDQHGERHEEHEQLR